MKPTITSSLTSFNIPTNEIHLLDYPAWIFEEKTLCITDANKKALEFCMYEHHELIGLSITKLWHDDDLIHILNDLFIHHFERSFYGNLNHRKKNGEIITMRVHALRMLNARTSWVIYLVPKMGGYK